MQVRHERGRRIPHCALAPAGNPELPPALTQFLIDNIPAMLASRHTAHVSTYGRYVVVGAIVGGATIAIREAFAAVLPDDSPIYYSSSVLMAYTIGIIFAYYAHRRFTFGGRRLANGAIHSFGLFTLVALLGLTIVTALSVATRYGLEMDQFFGGYGAAVAFALAAFLASVLTYALNSLYTFCTGRTVRHSGEARSGEPRGVSRRHPRDGPSS